MKKLLSLLFLFVALVVNAQPDFAKYYQEFFGLGPYQPTYPYSITLGYANTPSTAMPGSGNSGFGSQVTFTGNARNPNSYNQGYGYGLAFSGVDNGLYGNGLSDGGFNNVYIFGYGYTAPFGAAFFFGRGGVNFPGYWIGTNSWNANVGNFTNSITSSNANFTGALTANQGTITNVAATYNGSGLEGSPATGSVLVSSTSGGAASPMVWSGAAAPINTNSLPGYLPYWSTNLSVTDTNLPFVVVAADGSGNYTSIGAAVSNAVATGEFIWVKAGNYTNQNIYVAQSNLVISGSGNGTHVYYTTSPCFNVVTNDVTIQNMQIDGTNFSHINTPGQNGAIQTTNARTKIFNVYIHDVPDYAVVDTYGNDFEVGGCTFINSSFTNGASLNTNADGYCIYVQNSVRPSIHDNLLEGWSEVIALWSDVSGSITVRNRLINNFGFNGTNYTVPRAAFESFQNGAAFQGPNVIADNFIDGGLLHAFEVGQGCIGEKILGNTVTNLPLFAGTGTASTPNYDIILSDNHCYAGVFSASNNNAVSIQGVFSNSIFGGNLISGFTNANLDAIYVAASGGYAPDNLSFPGNTIENCYNGFAFDPNIGALSHLISISGGAIVVQNEPVYFGGGYGYVVDHVTATTTGNNPCFTTASSVTNCTFSNDHAYMLGQAYPFDIEAPWTTLNSPYVETGANRVTYDIYLNGSNCTVNGGTINDRSTSGSTDTMLYVNAPGCSISGVTAFSTAAQVQGMGNSTSATNTTFRNNTIVESGGFGLGIHANFCSVIGNNITDNNSSGGHTFGFFSSFNFAEDNVFNEQNSGSQPSAEISSGNTNNTVLFTTFLSGSDGWSANSTNTISGTSTNGTLGPFVWPKVQADVSLSTNYQATNLVNTVGTFTNNYTSSALTNINYLRGTNELVTVTNLVPGAIYTFAVMNYNGSAVLTNNGSLFGFPGVGLFTNSVSLGAMGTTTNVITIVVSPAKTNYNAWP